MNWKPICEPPDHTDSVLLWIEFESGGGAPGIGYYEGSENNEEIWELYAEPVEGTETITHWCEVDGPPS